MYAPFHKYEIIFCKFLWEFSVYSRLIFGNFFFLIKYTFERFFLIWLLKWIDEKGVKKCTQDIEKWVGRNRQNKKIFPKFYKKNIQYSMLLWNGQRWEIWIIPFYTSIQKNLTVAKKKKKGKINKILLKMVPTRKLKSLKLNAIYEWHLTSNFLIINSTRMNFKIALKNYK